ncbi:MAG: hypothetical protein ABIV48_01600 [Pyrinomonadaceae bacterium]
MRLIQVLLILVFAGVVAFAQSPTPPPPTPQPTTYPTPNFDAQRQLILEQQRQNAQFDRLRGAGADSKKVDSRSQASHIEISKLYRKSTGKELVLLAPDIAIYRAYRDFLNLSDTGIFKLAPDFGCANDNTVINASDECLKFTMPGGGNSYSFRKRDYRIRRLSDITYSKNRFDTSGLLSHGILVNLGDVDIRTIGLRSAGLAYVVNFEPVDDLIAAQRIEARLIEGIEDRGYQYQSGLEVVENATYVLRSVAYDGDLYRSLNGLVYDEFDFDKRSDVVVAFRVVEQAVDGSITLIWKEISRKKSPKLRRIEKPEPKKDNDASPLVSAPGN